MAKIVKLAPIDRIEGHLDIETVVSDATKLTTDAKCQAVMFRGIEEIMKKRDPRDAPIITQRPCGVCPTSHGVASSKNIGDAFGFRCDNDFVNGPDPIDVPNNGRLLRNLALGCNYVMSHLVHFYHLVALDYVNVNSTGLIPKGFACPNYDDRFYARGIDPTGSLGAPAYTVNNIGGAAGTVPSPVVGDLTAYFASQYVRALKFRRMAHQIHALFAGKMPHVSNFTPGAMTNKPYDSSPTGADPAVVQKFREILYAGPGYALSDRTHPLNGQPITVSNPHPESILGFIGKPTDFWNWVNGVSVTGTPLGGPLGGPFDPAALPLWAQVGDGSGTAGTNWQPYIGTHLFDVVAAAHVFPEYFWIGTGVNRHLAWGAFEGAVGDAPWIGTGHADNRLCTRFRTHVNPTTGAVIGWYPVDHLDSVEMVDSSWYDDTAGKKRHMWQGKTKWNPDKAGAYSYAKSPRYYNASSGTGHPVGHLPYEVGPLSRMMANAKYVVDDGGLGNPVVLNAVVSGDRTGYYPGILSDVDQTLVPTNPWIGGSGVGIFPSAGQAPTDFTAGPYGSILYGNYLNALASPAVYKSNYTGDGVLDRIAARALETYYVAKHLWYWFNQLDPNETSNVTRRYSWGEGKGWKEFVPKYSKGVGLTEAPRGALGHWIKIGNRKKKKLKGKISKYQIITPTAWLVSPKVDAGLGDAHGPMEESLVGTPLQIFDEPIELLRIVHSFDPCLACTVHVMTPKKEKVAEAIVEPAG